MMEQYIIDPVRDAGSERSDVEDTDAGEAPTTWNGHNKGETEEQRSLIEQLGVALGITKAYQKAYHSGRRGSNSLSTKQTPKRGAEERNLLADAEGRSRGTREENRDAEVEEDGTEPSMRRVTTLMEHVTARSKSFVVFTISPSKVEEEQLQTQDILSRIHKHNKESKIDDAAAGAVRVRDIRLFLSSGRGVPSIVSRRNCLLVSLPYVRMIILHSLVCLIPIGCNNFPREAARYEQTERRCKLLQKTTFSAADCNTEAYFTRQRQYDSAQFTSGVSRQFSSGRSTSSGTLTDIDATILEKLAQLMQVNSSTPYEYLALETALVDSSDVLRRQIRLARYTASVICSALRRGFGVTAAVLLRINSLRKIVYALKQDVSGVVNSLNDVLGDDETLRRLAISEMWDEPQLWEAAQYSTTPRRVRQTRLKHDVEMLLECYSQDGDTMLKNVKSIDEYIDDSLAMVELHLAMQRNFLLKADVWMTTLATVIGFFALVPGCFGMNIRHGFEKAPSSVTIFWSITGAIFSATILTGVIVCFFLRNLTI